MLGQKGITGVSIASRYRLGDRCSWNLFDKMCYVPFFHGVVVHVYIHVCKHNVYALMTMRSTLLTLTLVNGSIGLL